MSRSMHTARGLRRRTQVLLLVVLLAPLAAPLLYAGRSRSAPAAAPEHSIPMTDAGLPKPLLGFAINAHHIGRLSLYLDGVDAIRDLGANTLIVVTPMYQKYADSNEIRHLRSRCPSDEQLLAILRRGREHGMFTILMPILLIEKPGDKDWRGVIRPTDWDAWWASYDGFIDRFVDIAVKADVGMLSIGSELNTTEAQVERWKRVVSRVRERYAGKLTYSANWDRYRKCDLWPLVDVMSVSAYFELDRERPGAPEADIVRAWDPIRAELLDAARRWDKPLMMSEVGYPSLSWANAHPWNYVAEDDSATDHGMQARCWRALFTAWTSEIAEPASPLLGFCGYRWDPYHAGEDGDTGYGIVGKPAQEVIRRGFAGVRRAAEAQRAEGDRP